MIGQSVYETFEHVIMLVLTLPIVAFATWHLVLQVLGLLLNQLDPADLAVFRDVFAMLFLM